jgi:hypothetical protein
MLFCPSVRSITIIDEIDSSTFRIKRRGSSNEEKNVIKETEFIEECSNIEQPVIRRFISIEIEENSEEISNHWKTQNRNLRLHIAVEVDEDNNVLSIPSSSPAVYCSLPLIGFEKMSLPFYVNSNDFEPATERTALYLKKKRFEYRSNEDTGEDEKFYLQSGINWAILERSVPLYERIVDYLISNQYEQRYNLINGLGSILKGAWEKDTKNCLASRFILPLRSMLITKKLVKTNTGYRSIASDAKFVECAKDCDVEKNLYTEFYLDESTKNYVHVPMYLHLLNHSLLLSILIILSKILNSMPLIIVVYFLVLFAYIILCNNIATYLFLHCIGNV